MEKVWFQVPRLSNRDRCLPTRLGGILHEVSTEGQWSQGESLLHINCLELLAGAFAVKTFVKGKVQKRVRLLMDNLTATH